MRESPSEETAQLRKCLNDLVSVMALPSLWASAEPNQIIDTLLDAISRMLGLAFILIRRKDSDGSASITAVRIGPPFESERDPQLEAEINQTLASVPLTRFSGIPATIRAVDLRVACTPLGVNGEFGMLVAGSARLDFPRQPETLLLDVAANQAAVALDREQRLMEYQRVARELDERVAQRTKELAEANKRLEERDRESRLIIDNIPGMIALLSPTGDIDRVNRPLLEYFGQTLEQLRLWGTNDTVHPEDLPHVIEVFSESIAAGTPYEILQRFKRWDGVYRWFQNRGYPLRDSNGAVTRWCILLTDIEDQKQAEERLRESEYESRLTVDSIPAMVAVVNTTGEIERVSQPVSDYYGKSLEELNQWFTSDGIHPDDRPGLIQAFTESLSSGDPLEFEARARRFDGVYRWFQTRGRPLRDRQNRIVRWYFVQTDVEELKRAEETLKKSERNLKTIIDTIPGVCWSARPDGSADFLNQTYLDYTGLSAEEGMGWGWTAAIHPDDLDGLLAAWQGATSAGQAGSAEARLRKHTGEYRWFLFLSKPLRDEGGNIIKWYGTNIDIEERKRTEERLRHNQEFLTRAQHISSSGCFSWYVDTNEVTFSEGAYRIFGYEPNSPVTIERNISRIHPDDLPLMAAMGNAARGAGGDQDYEIRLQMPDGSIKHVHTISNVVVDSSGRRCSIGAIQDITQRKLAEEAINRARAELAHVARVSTLSALTASIAHEINQPLSGIITNASTCQRMLHADPPNIEGARETARRTIRDGNRASDVLARLRALFSKRDFTLEEMDLNDAAREVIALTLSDLQRNMIAVRPEFAEDLPPVKGDRIQLQQVILNLVRNASEAMADVRDRPRTLLIRTELEDDRSVRLIVRDSGSGFKGEIADKIFDSFYTTKSGGMGIGLSVSRSIIERHQGRLWAEANDGPGATFIFTIPSAAANSSPAESGVKGA